MMVHGAAGLRPRVLVFAYHDLGAACLRVLLQQGAHLVGVVTHEDDPGERIWFESVAAVASRHGLSVFMPEDPNAPAFIARVAALAPDLLFSFYYRRLLGPALLALPRLGAVNLHGSLLPKYRGRAPLNWVLVHGETETGVTLHFMDDRADHGDIIAQRAVPIAIEDTALTLWRKLVAAGEALLAEAYPLLAEGRAPHQPQDHAAATIMRRRTPADGCIDWSGSAWQIYNLIRAVTHPFPGAFTFLGERRVFVWQARPPVGRRAGAPGQILGLGTEGLEVGTGAGGLELLRLQEAGGPERSGAEFLAVPGVAGGRFSSFPCALAGESGGQV